MKKNYKFLIIALLAIIGLASCKKDDDTAKDPQSITTDGLKITAGGKTYLVSKFKTSNKDYLEFSYNSEGRLTKYNLFENGEYRDMNFSYDGNTITVTHIDDDESTIVLKLDANGYGGTAITTESFKNPPYTYNSETKAKFTYDAEGYLIKVEESTVETNDGPNATPRTYSTTTDFTYANGNLIRSVNKSEGWTYTEEYEYYTDKPNIPFLFDTYQTSLLGKTSKNLVKKATYTYDDGRSQLGKHESTYSYTFNTDGLPITATADDGTKITIEYITK